MTGTACPGVIAGVRLGKGRTPDFLYGRG
jgi:hypothetical protein